MQLQKKTFCIGILSAALALCAFDASAAAKPAATPSKPSTQTKIPSQPVSKKPTRTIAPPVNLLAPFQGESLVDACRPRPGAYIELGHCTDLNMDLSQIDPAYIGDWSPRNSGLVGETLTIEGRNLPEMELKLAGQLLVRVGYAPNLITYLLPDTPVTGPLVARRLTDGRSATLVQNYVVSAPEAPHAFDFFEPSSSQFSWTNAHLLALGGYLLYEDDLKKYEDAFGTTANGTCQTFTCRYKAMMKSFGMQRVDLVDPANIGPLAPEFVPYADTQAAVMSNDNLVIVTFRGTEINVSDIITDITFNPVAPPEGWVPEELSAQFLPLYFMRIHAGFKTAFDLMYPQVKSKVEQHLGSGKHVWVTGHSLGGALAALTAYGLSNDGIAVEGVHTFGTPHVGNSFWHQAHESVPYRTWRWVIEGDPVPMLLYTPLELINDILLGYTHVGIVNNIYTDPSVPVYRRVVVDDEEKLFGFEPSGLWEEHSQYDQEIFREIERRRNGGGIDADAFAAMPQPAGGF